jgi:hypothetical protein
MENGNSDNDAIQDVRPRQCCPAVNMNASHYVIALYAMLHDHFHKEYNEV